MVEFFPILFNIQLELGLNIQPRKAYVYNKSHSEGTRL
jgi:hypothetical protein